MANKNLIPIVTSLSIVVFILNPGSCLNLRPRVKLYESFLQASRNAIIPIVQFDGRQIRNLTQFQLEYYLKAIEHICLNGWWLIYEYEGYNEESGRIDLASGDSYYCFNVTDRIGSIRTISSPDSHLIPFAGFSCPNFLGNLTAFGSGNDFFNQNWTASSEIYELRSGIIPGNGAWTLASSKKFDDGICFKPKPNISDNKPNANKACLLRNIDETRFKNASFWKYLKPGCHSARIVELTECVSYGNAMMNIGRRVTPTCSQNTAKINSNTKSLPTTAYEKYRFETQLHPMLSWRRQITDKILTVFKRSCTSAWVNPDFLNLAIDLYFLELNDAVIPLELDMLGIRNLKHSRKKDTVRVYEQVPMPSICTLMNNILEVCAWNCADRLNIRPILNKPGKFQITKASGITNKIPDVHKIADNMNPVLESIWLMFSMSFGICVGDTDLSLVHNRLNQFMIAMEQFFFPSTISRNWLRISNSTRRVQMYEDLFNGFNIPSTLKNMSICESAAYAINDLHSSWKPSRPFQHPDFKHAFI